MKTLLKKNKKKTIVYRSSRPEVFCKKGVLRNFAKFTGKHLCQSFFFNKVAGLRPATLLKKRLWHRCFPVNLVEFLRTLFLRWLLLCIYIFFFKQGNVISSMTKFGLIKCWTIFGVLLFLPEAVVRRCSIEISILKNFTKFTGKHLCQSLFFNQVVKKETLAQVFSCEFCEIFKKKVFTENLRTTASEQLLNVSTKKCKYFFHFFLL